MIILVNTIASISILFLSDFRGVTLLGKKPTPDVILPGGGGLNFNSMKRRCVCSRWWHSVYKIQLSLTDCCCVCLPQAKTINWMTALSNSSVCRSLTLSTFLYLVRINIWSILVSFVSETQSLLCRPLRDYRLCWLFAWHGHWSPTRSTTVNTDCTSPWFDKYCISLYALHCCLHVPLLGEKPCFLVWIFYTILGFILLFYFTTLCDNSYINSESAILF